MFIYTPNASPNPKSQQKTYNEAPFGHVQTIGKNHNTFSKILTNDFAPNSNFGLARLSLHTNESPNPKLGEHACNEAPFGHVQKIEKNPTRFQKFAQTTSLQTRTLALLN